MAIRERALFAKDFECNRICVESDSLGAVRRITNETQDSSHNGSTMLDIFFLLPTFLMLSIAVMCRVGSMIMLSIAVMKCFLLLSFYIDL